MLAPAVLSTILRVLFAGGFVAPMVYLACGLRRPVRFGVILAALAIGAVTDPYAVAGLMVDNTLFGIGCG